MKTKTLLLVVIFTLLTPFFSSSSKPFSNTGCLQADIVMVMDWSGSTMDKRMFMASAAFAYSRSLPLSEDGIKIGIISFNDSSIIQSYLTADTNEIDEGIVSLLSDTKERSSYADYVSLQTKELMIRSEIERRRPPQKRFVIFISDGELDGDKSKVLEEMRVLQETMGITIVSIHIGKEPNSLGGGWQFMFSMATSGQFFFTSTYEKLRQFLEGLNLCV